MGAEAKGRRMRWGRLGRNGHGNREDSSFESSRCCLRSSFIFRLLVEYQSTLFDRQQSCGERCRYLIRIPWLPYCHLDGKHRNTAPSFLRAIPLFSFFTAITYDWSFITHAFLGLEHDSAHRVRKNSGIIDCPGLQIAFIKLDCRESYRKPHRSRHRSPCEVWTEPKIWATRHLYSMKESTSWPTRVSLPSSPSRHRLISIGLTGYSNTPYSMRPYLVSELSTTPSERKRRTQFNVRHNVRHAQARTAVQHGFGRLPLSAPSTLERASSAQEVDPDLGDCPIRSQTMFSPWPSPSPFASSFAPPPACPISACS